MRARPRERAILSFSTGESRAIQFPSNGSRSRKMDSPQHPDEAFIDHHVKRLPVEAIGISNDIFTLRRSIAPITLEIESAMNIEY